MMTDESTDATTRGTMRMPRPDTPIILSAYNASAAGLADRSQDESTWYGALRDLALVDGLELAAVHGQLHPRGTAHLARLLSPVWRNVVSGMGGTLVRLGDDPSYGLASVSRSGRAAALDDVEALRHEVHALRSEAGDDSVIAVVLHSAPRADRSSREAFDSSLMQIVSGEWGGLPFLVEHADALVADHEPQKGWLELADEIAAIRAVRAQTGADIRLLINWGRNAIESRSADGAQSLLRDADDSGMLGAIVLSGASGSSIARGGEWADVHLGLSSDEPDSLLTLDHARSALALASSDTLFLGVKMGAPHDAGEEPVERLRYASAALRALFGTSVATEGEGGSV